MGSIDGTLIIAGAALALAAIAVGFALGAVINLRELRRDLVDLIKREGDLAAAEIGAYSARLDTAVRTATQARDTMNATKGVVDGLQHGAERMRETVASMGLELQNIESRVGQRNDALIAEIAGPLQAVQQRAINLEHDVRNVEQSLALMARANEPAPRTGAGERQPEARSSAFVSPADNDSSSSVTLADDEQAKVAPANAPPTSPSPAILVVNEDAALNVDADVDIERSAPSTLSFAPDWLRPKPQGGAR